MLRLRKKVKRPHPDNKTIPVTVRFTPEDHARVMEKAKRWAEGNVSELVRQASTSFVPGASELESRVKSRT